jgi:uncharacterized protein (DUF1501 family)
VALTRRRFLERSSLLTLGAAARPDRLPGLFLRPQRPGRAVDTLVVIFQRGGADGLSMVVPFGEGGNYYSRRQTTGIPEPGSTSTGKAVDLDGFFGLHPSLGAPDKANWLEWYQTGRLAIVHAAHLDDPDHTRSHFDAMDYMERGTPGKKRLQTGWLGRHLAATAAPDGSPFRGVGMGAMLQLALRCDVPAVVLQSIADFGLKGRPAEMPRFQAHLERLYQGDDWLAREGRATFAAVQLLLQQVGQAPYVPANGAQYDRGDYFHRTLMQVAQLIRADIGLEAACVDVGGWDTHANQVLPDEPTRGYLADHLQRFGTGITAFLTDLGDRLGSGAGPGVTVVTMSEFGRRGTENASLGTDHGHGSVMFLFGGGIRGGKVYTHPWPTLAESKLDRGDLAGTTDYRDVLGEILVKRLLTADPAAVFPDHTFTDLGLATPLAAPATPTATATASPTSTAGPTARPTANPTAGPTANPTATATEESLGRNVYLPLAGRS